MGLFQISKKYGIYDSKMLLCKNFILFWEYKEGKTVKVCFINLNVFPKIF